MAVVELNIESYNIRVPGKLMVAGEYAILESGHEAILIAIDRYMTVEIFPDQVFNLTIGQYKLKKVEWQIQEGQLKWLGLVKEHDEDLLRYVKKAIEVANDYCLGSQKIPKTYGLVIHSNLEEVSTGIKYGLGSSAAVVVAVISGILALHHHGLEQVDKELIYKLAYMAHLKTQGNGSGADIATSVYGGWFIYGAPDFQWLKSQIEVVSLSNLLTMTWPQLKLHKITPPKSVKIMVGWSGYAMSTAKMVQNYQFMAESNPEAHKLRLVRSKELMTQLIQAFEADNDLEIIDGIKAYRQWLKELDMTGDIGIMTPKLKALCEEADYYGAGKPSGAGGGDCGIAFLAASESTDNLAKCWQNHEIVPLNLAVSKSGVACTTLYSKND